MNVSKDKSLSDNKVNSLIFVILYATIPIVLLIFFMLVGNYIYLFLNKKNLMLQVMLVQTIPAFFALIIVPSIVYAKSSERTVKELIRPLRGNMFTKCFLVCISVFYILILCVYKNYTFQIIPFIIHFFVIAIGEELLVRGIITEQLGEIWDNSLFKIIGSAIIFSFIFHSESDISICIFSHMPFAIIMSLIYKKTGTLEMPILIHWIYNVILTLIEVM